MKSLALDSQRWVSVEIVIASGRAVSLRVPGS